MIEENFCQINSRGDHRSLYFNNLNDAQNFWAQITEKKNQNYLKIARQHECSNIAESDNMTLEIL